MEQELLSQFSYLGIAVENDDDVIAKCLELCNVYRITPETLVEQWTAFSVSRLNGAGQPTVDRLQKLERDSLSKLRPTGQQSSPALARQSATSTPSKSSRRRVDFINESLTNDLSILEEYSTGDITARWNKSTRSADVSLIENGDELRMDSDAELESVGFKVAFALNEASEAGSEWPMVGEQQQRAVLNIRFENEEWMRNAKPEYMCRVNARVKQRQCERTDCLARAIINRFGLTNIFTFIEVSSEKFVTFGRVIRDSVDADDVYLEGSADFAPAQEALLDLSLLNGATRNLLFSGQVVVLESICCERNVLMPQRVYSDASLPLAQWPLLRDVRSTTANETLQFVVVAGPFVRFDCGPNDGPIVLHLQNFRKMLSVVQQLRPHVLIVLGPFFDHESATRDDIGPLDDLFEQILELMYQQLSSLKPEIFIVPSSHDAHHINVYPTPPYRKYTSHSTAANVHFLPNPCIFHIDSLAIGISTFDTLFEMNKYEIALKDHKHGDKIASFVRHLIEQQSFYPIYPDLSSFSDRNDLVNESDDIKTEPVVNNIDSVLVDRRCHFSDFTPHVLILPSQFVHFAKIVNETLALNPGKCCAGGTGSGSLARFRFEPNCESVNDSVRCQLIRF